MRLLEPYFFVGIGAHISRESLENRNLIFIYRILDVTSIFATDFSMVVSQPKRACQYLVKERACQYLVKGNVKSISVPYNLTIIKHKEFQIPYVKTLTTASVATPPINGCGNRDNFQFRIVNSEDHWASHPCVQDMLEYKEPIWDLYSVSNDIVRIQDRGSLVRNISNAEVNMDKNNRALCSLLRLRTINTTLSIIENSTPQEVLDSKIPSWYPVFRSCGFSEKLGMSYFMRASVLVPATCLPNTEATGLLNKIERTQERDGRLAQRDLRAIIKMLNYDTSHIIRIQNIIQESANLFG